MINSALELFEKHGFAATSVQQIADHASVSKGAFYHHFEKKEDVLLLIHDEFQDVQLAETERITSAFGTATEQLREVVRASIASTARYRSHVNVFFQERRFLTDDGYAAVKHKRDETERLLLSIVEAGIASGEFKPDLDAQVFVFSLIGMIVWTNQWFHPGGRLNSDDVGNRVTDMVLEGIETEKGSAGKSGRRRRSESAE